jgi:hypothetical protein
MDVALYLRHRSLGALAFDRPLFGNWIWHIAPEKVRDYEEHSGVSGKTPHQVARAGSMRGIADADMARGGSTICARSLADGLRFLRINPLYRRKAVVCICLA